MIELATRAEFVPRQSRGPDSPQTSEAEALSLVLRANTCVPTALQCVFRLG